MSHEQQPLLTRRERVLLSLAKHLSVLDNQPTATVVSVFDNSAIRWEPHFSRVNLYPLCSLLPGDVFYFINHPRTFGVCYVLNVRAGKTVNSITIKSFEHGEFTFGKNQLGFNWMVQVLKPSLFTTNDLKK